MPIHRNQPAFLSPILFSPPQHFPPLCPAREPVTVSDGPTQPWRVTDRVTHQSIEIYHTFLAQTSAHVWGQSPRCASTRVSPGLPTPCPATVKLFNRVFTTHQHEVSMLPDKIATLPWHSRHEKACTRSGLRSAGEANVPTIACSKTRSALINTIPTTCLLD